MEDTAIIELYWARNEDALIQTDQKYGPMCRSLAFNILSDRQDSEECVNDTWHRAWDTIPPQRPDSLRAYLGRIVRNLSISRLRKRTAQKRGGGLDVMLSELEDCLPDAGGVEDKLERRELAAAISRWLRTLSPDDRVLFVRRYWYGEPSHDLALKWDLLPNQMAKRMLKLRRSLKQFLEQEGFDV